MESKKSGGKGTKRGHGENWIRENRCTRRSYSRGVVR